jgi:hypothetical protein
MSPNFSRQLFPLNVCVEAPDPLLACEESP